MTQLMKIMNSTLSLSHRSLDTRYIATARRASSWTSDTKNVQNLNNSRYSSDEEDGRRNDKRYARLPMVGTSFAILGLFESSKDEEEDKEPELITTIKRSILLIQKEEYKKAEQMLHVALRLAQELQHYDGITYIYDIMANLALEVGEYDKAEKLFVKTMQRLLGKGIAQNDLKIIHISLKMAKMFEHKQEYVKAEQGYLFCLQNLQEHIDEQTTDRDIITLWAMNLDWYAHMLLSQNRSADAFKYMHRAYELSVKLNGTDHDQTVVLLNDLGSISFLSENYDEAINYLRKATEIGKKLPKMEDLGSIHVNLGNVLLKKGLYKEAEKSCKEGWRLSKAMSNNESLEEAKACLDEIQKLLKQ